MLFVSRDWLKIVKKLKGHSNINRFNINRFKVLSQGKERKKKKKKDKMTHIMIEKSVA